MPIDEVQQWYEKVFEKNEKRSIRLVYYLIGAFMVITGCRSFPNTMLPEVLYPDDLQKYRRVKLKYIAQENPLAAARIFWLRLQRGEYKQWIMDNFALVPIKFLVPAEGETMPWWTVITSMFHHGSVGHNIGCITAAYTLIGQSVGPVVGPVRALAAWFVISVAANLLDLGLLKITKQAALERGEHRELIPMTVQKRNPETGEKFLATEMHVKPEFRSALLYHLGSSGGLMGLMTITAFMSPGMMFGIPLVKWFSFTARSFAGVVIGFDIMGATGLLGNTGIGHWAHLFGDLAGAIVWFVWFKKLPNVKMWQKTKFYRGE